MIFAGKSRWLIPFCGVLLLLLGSTSATQNLEFRMAAIERRIDQLQNRIDTVEREQRNQTFSNSTRPAVAPETVQELQRQYLSLAEQVVVLQRRMLEVQKTLDQKQEPPKEKPQETPKRKP